MVFVGGELDQNFGNVRLALHNLTEEPIHSPRRRTGKILSYVEAPHNSIPAMARGVRYMASPFNWAIEVIRRPDTAEQLVNAPLHGF